MSFIQMSRRRFLQALGLGAGATVMPRLARANSQAPKRLIVFYTQHGTWYDGWKMRPNGQPEDQFWTADLPSQFSQALAPLEAFRDHMIVADGLALVSAELEDSSLKHELGQVHSLTGAKMELLSGIPLASQPSIDQRIADVIAHSGQFRSLEFAIGEVPISVNYSGSKQIMPFISNPDLAHQKLFGPSGDASLLAELTAMQPSLLNESSIRYQKVRNKVGSSRAEKLASHEALLNDLSTRISGLSTLREQCGNHPELDYGEYTYEEDFAAFSQLAASAFSCDLSRVCTFHMGQLSGQQVTGRTLDLHNDYAHSVWVDEEAQEIMTQYTAVHSQHVASLAALLDSQIDPLGDGFQTLLDNTMILWVGELGDASHGFQHWPAVIVGGQGFSGWTHGKLIHHPSTTPVEAWSYLGNLPAMGLPHQHLLNSVAQSFGVQAPVGEKELILPDGTRLDVSTRLGGLV